MSVEEKMEKNAPVRSAGVKKRGLGKGLDALLAGGAVSVAAEAGNRDYSQFQQLHAQLLIPGPWQPRRVMDTDTLAELADSIRQQGLMQPVVVRPAEAGQYQIIAGERRWRACQQAGLELIPVVIRDVSDADATIMALIENIQRENLNPIEEAQALGRLQRDGGLTQLQVAEAVGKSRSAVANLLRLLKLTPEVQVLLEEGVLEMGHARTLLPLGTLQQARLAEEAIQQKMTVRELEHRVRQILLSDSPESTDVSAMTHRTAADSAVLKKHASLLSEKYKTRVSIKTGAKGQGHIVLAYDSPAALEKLLQQLN
ncbi:MAG: ParB/RepB/Spo0J family partition protein [Marinobacterium sp.]|nr:ParB/RepB/Spo0J family partition protein [Marinobacterium sp.]